MRIKVKVVPNAKENKIDNLASSESLRVKIKAPPTNNQANKALLEFLSKEYKKQKNKIRIIAGLTSRNKIIEIDD